MIIINIWYVIIYDDAMTRSVPCLKEGAQQLLTRCLINLIFYARIKNKSYIKIKCLPSTYKFNTKFLYFVLQTFPLLNYLKV